MNSKQNKKEIKKRLDIIILERGIAQSRHRAQALIGAGKVFVNGRMCDKAGTKFIPSEIEVKLKEQDHPFVSRGGLKLDHALSEFNITIDNNICMDVGASTGGFTDCLLQHGAKKVYSIDVGYGQLDYKLRTDPRVVVMERTNIRYLPPGSIPDPISICTVDTSFISLKIVVPSILKHLESTAKIIALIKPQFEAGRKYVKKGVIRDESVREAVVEDLVEYFKSIDLKVLGVTPSPILGPKGNKEFLVLLESS